MEESAETPETEESKKVVGRPSKFAGKIVKATVSENPRRADTHGYRSFEILLKHPEGMTYDEFITAGGRRNDLLYDVDRNRASISDPA